MYLRRNRRLKDGKEHCYWNIVESKRCAGGKIVQRQVLYLGEINDSQREAWCEVIEAFDEGSQRPTQLALFPAERAMKEHAKGYDVQVRLDRWATRELGANGRQRPRIEQDLGHGQDGRGGGEGGHRGTDHALRRPERCGRL
jgi:hypothetical protein